MENTELYTRKLIKRGHTYFFDIKRNEKNTLYFTINESNKRVDSYEHQRILVSEEDIPDFVDAFWDCMTSFEQLKNENKIPNIGDYYSQIRQTYPKAYMPWTQDEDDRLVFLFSEGFKVAELSKILQRNEGAIESRIRKMEIRRV